MCQPLGRSSGCWNTPHIHFRGAEPARKIDILAVGRPGLVMGVFARFRDVDLTGIDSLAIGNEDRVARKSLEVRHLAAIRRPQCVVRSLQKPQ